MCKVIANILSWIPVPIDNLVQGKTVAFLNAAQMSINGTTVLDTYQISLRKKSINRK